MRHEQEWSDWNSYGFLPIHVLSAIVISQHSVLSICATQQDMLFSGCVLGLTIRVSADYRPFQWTDALVAARMLLF